ncbi:MAG: ribonuclease HI family protein [Euryarchaeota archaeon]|nr:ribonuclease HI family protein [Euryarchaeota archaeon]
MKLQVFTDGGSRGNPGPAAFAIVVTDGTGKILKEYARYIGKCTNNEAEYRGAIAALEEAMALGADEVELVSDSQLLVRQVNGQYACRAANLKPHLAKVRKLAKEFSRVTFTSVGREHPMVARADALLNHEQDVMRELTPRGRANP